MDVLTVTSAGTYALYAEDAEGCPTHNEVEVTSAPGPELSCSSIPTSSSVAIPPLC